MTKTTTYIYTIAGTGSIHNRINESPWGRIAYAIATAENETDTSYFSRFAPWVGVRLEADASQAWIVEIASDDESAPEALDAWGEVVAWERVDERLVQRPLDESDRTPVAVLADMYESYDLVSISETHERHAHEVDDDCPLADLELIVEVRGLRRKVLWDANRGLTSQEYI